MKTFNKRPLTPWIGKAVSHAVKAAMFASLISVSSAYANSTSELRSVKSEITRLEKSIQLDQQAVKQLERVIWGLDAKILDAQKLIRKERDIKRSELHDVKRDVKKQGFDIERLNNAIALVDKEIELVQRDSQRSQEAFQRLNALKKQFEETSHLEKLSENQAKVEKLLVEKQGLIETRDSAVSEQQALQEKLASAKASLEDSTLEGDSRFTNLVKKRERSGTQITSMRKQLKNDQGRLSFLSKKANQIKAKINANKKANKKPTAVAKAKPAPKQQPTQPASLPGKRPAYVFVISGEQKANIEDSLKLKDWVESYGAKYIQAKWNGLEGSETSTPFMQQFSEQLSQIEERAKLIIIGHGRGGGAAIRAATEVAFNANRTVEFLAVIDPIGEENLRANIVYNTSVSCSQPKKDDQLSNTEYVSCLKESKKRLITANVKHFYNRWQKDSKGPADYYRNITAIDENGEDINSPTSTGRFITAQSTKADQKRVFFGGAEQAHTTLLNDEARNLPRLLVKHLR